MNKAARSAERQTSVEGQVAGTLLLIQNDFQATAKEVWHGSERGKVLKKRRVKKRSSISKKRASTAEAAPNIVIGESPVNVFLRSSIKSRGSSIDSGKSVIFTI